MAYNLPHHAFERGEALFLVFPRIVSLREAEHRSHGHTVLVCPCGPLLHAVDIFVSRRPARPPANRIETQLGSQFNGFFLRNGRTRRRRAVYSYYGAVFLGPGIALFLGPLAARIRVVGVRYGRKQARFFVMCRLRRHPCRKQQGQGCQCTYFLNLHRFSFKMLLLLHIPVNSLQAAGF